MNLCINYIDSEVTLSFDYITSIEIENKQLFYHLVNDFNLISQGNLIEDICMFENNIEINMSNKFFTVIDYFNLDLNNKKILSNLYKFLIENIEEKEYLKLNQCYDKIVSIITKVSNNTVLPIEINNEFDLEIMMKLLKISVAPKNKLIDTLFLLIDIYKEFNIKQIITLINIKQVLEKEEIIELYKYAVYNQVMLFLIDYGYYGVSLTNEKKIIIDNNLEEFVL